MKSKERKRAPSQGPRVVNGVSASFALLLFLSGAAGLIYQVLWVRQLSLVVGIEVYSITIAVSSFFAGLALGGALLGRLADGWKRPLLLYAVLEASIAVAGFAATVALSHTAGVFVAMQSRSGALAWALPILIVGTPAFLMGGTLPVAIRWQARTTTIAKAGGWVYAVNTAGGIAGALLSSFLLIAWLGVRGTAFAAALLNLIAAGIAVTLARKSIGPIGATKAPGESAADGSSVARLPLALTLYALAGAVALGYEVVWSQAMAQFLSTRVFAFSVVLATYLAGLVLGSALYGRFAHRVRDPWGAFGVLISGAGVIALLEIAFLNLWQLQIQFKAAGLMQALTGSEFARMCTSFAVAAFGVVFLPTILLGAAFPAVLQLAAKREDTGRDVGSLLALNTAGGIAGTLLTGFFLIPVLGVVRTLGFLAVVAAAIGAAAVFGGTSKSRNAKWGICILAVIAIAATALTPKDRLARLLLTTRGGGELAFYDEGRGATVAVSQDQSKDHVFRRLYIQGVSNSGDAMPSLRYMRLQAMLPLIIHRGEPKSALVIGFGTGITAGAVLRYPGLQRRVCVEVLPAVIRGGALFPENYKAWSDPGMQIRIGDGRQELLRSDRKYDVITLEPPPPSAAGVVNLYSTDFYRLASRHLETNGLFAQWLPLAAQNDEETRSLVRSFLDVFPYATLWTTELHEMLLIGSYAPIELDANQIKEHFDHPDVTRALGAVGISSPAALLATWVTDREGLEKYAENAHPVTDNDPRIEYAAWVRPTEITVTLPKLLDLRTEPPLVGGSDELRSGVSRERETLINFYTAGLAAYNGDRDDWEEAMQKVQAADGKNPYYAWVTGESK